MFDELGMDEANDVGSSSYEGLPRHYGYRTKPEQTGMGGAELKHVIPTDSEVMFVVPFGDYPKGYDKDDVYIGKDIPGINIFTFWMNRGDVTDAAAEAMYLNDKQRVFTRKFICARKETANSFWKDLGYFGTNREGKDAVANNEVTHDSWNRVYPHGNFFAGNEVAPKLWHNVPLIRMELSGKGKNQKVELVELVWLLINGAQFRSFVDAWKGLSRSKNPSIQNRVLSITNNSTAAPSDRYVYAREDVDVPEELHEAISDGYETIKTAITEFYTEVLNNQQGGVPPTIYDEKQDVASNNATREYLTGISVWDTWDEFVENYSITAKPVDLDDYVEASSPFDLETE